MNQTLVLYHGGCRDGFCAAWVVNKYMEATGFPLKKVVEYIPVYHGQEPPDVKGKDVIIVDFCYPLETMKQIGRDAKSVIWIDHHKTAEPVYNDISISSPHNMYQAVVFRNDKSGAGLAWDYFFGDRSWDSSEKATNRPWLVNYVEDRDLWNKKLEATDEVNAYVSCLEFNFDVWDRASAETVGWAANAGKIAQMKTEQYVREVCKNMYIRDINGTNDRDVFGHVLAFDTRILYPEIPTVNICQVDCSEVLHELCKLYPDSLFSLYWFRRHDGLYQYGIRSIGDFDCSTVAKLFGGGGHKNAAGFQLPYLLEELK